MGYKATTPQTAEVSVLQPRELGEYRIYNINIRIDPNNPMENSIYVDFAEGYMDGATFRPVNRTSRMFKGTPMQQAILAQVSVGSTRYDEVKKGVWDMLKSEALVPEGMME